MCVCMNIIMHCFFTFMSFYKSLLNSYCKNYIVCMGFENQVYFKWASNKCIYVQVNVLVSKYVCVYVLMYVCMYVCMYVFMHENPASVSNLSSIRLVCST